MKDKKLIFGLLSLMVSTAAVAQSESKWAVKNKVLRKRKSMYAA